MDLPGVLAEPQSNEQKAALRSNRRFDPNAGLVALDGVSLRKSWSRLSGARPESNQTEAERSFFWHWKKAEELGRGPQWPLAVDQLSLAIKDRPNLAATWSRRSRWYRELGEWDKAIADLSHAILLQPGSSTLRMERAEACFRVGRLEEARTDYRRLISMEAEDMFPYNRLALAHLALGDDAGYRSSCADMLARFRGSPDPHVCNQIAWACSLGPGAPETPVLISLAQRAAAESPPRPGRLNTLGAALYRAGRFEEAIRSLTEAVALRGKHFAPEDWLFLAMAERRFGRFAKAREWLAKYRAWNERAENKSSYAWNELVEFRVLEREVEDVLAGAR
jgi:tetratricopeptide (TPR) repeat protein